MSPRPGRSPTAQVPRGCWAPPRGAGPRHRCGHDPRPPSPPPPVRTRGSGAGEARVEAREGPAETPATAMHGWRPRTTLRSGRRDGSSRCADGRRAGCGRALPNRQRHDLSLFGPPGLGPGRAPEGLGPCASTTPREVIPPTPAPGPGTGRSIRSVGSAWRPRRGWGPPRAAACRAPRRTGRYDRDRAHAWRRLEPQEGSRGAGTLQPSIRHAPCSAAAARSPLRHRDVVGVASLRAATAPAISPAAPPTGRSCRSGFGRAGGTASGGPR